MIRQKLLGSVSVAAFAVAFAACEGGTADGLTGLGSGGATDSLAVGSGSNSSSSVGALRLRCEVRSNRSKISVDGKNLAVGSYTAMVSSGSHTASAGPHSSIGDEVEFDFDSDPGDIAEGATAIARDFIQTASNPDVTALIKDAAGNVVASAGANCRVK